MLGQLDADPVRTEPVDQIGQRPLRGLRTTLGKSLADMSFAAAG